jgi:DNA-directed RNA polymerase subunit RPC12/RpoP
MDLEQDVKTHTRRVESGERVRYGHACPQCGAREEKSFGLHDCRRRKFRLVIGQYIQVALSWILRWRCLRCGKRFTDYPPFRFAAEAVYQVAGVGEGQRVSGD